MKLDELKNSYNEKAKKYNLVSFKELNDDFEIEKIDRESDSLLRVVRKVLVEKVLNSMSFLELLLNPSNAPRMYLAYVKSVTIDDRKIIDEIYTKLGEISLRVLDLEIDYSEKAEAETITRIYTTWQTLKPSFRKIMSKMKKPESLIKREKSYFG